MPNAAERFCKLLEVKSGQNILHKESGEQKKAKKGQPRLVRWLPQNERGEGREYGRKKKKPISDYKVLAHRLPSCERAGDSIRSGDL